MAALLTRQWRCDNYDAVFAIKRRGSKRSAPVASHPLDIVTALIVTAGVISMDEMWKASLLNAQHFAWNSVQESSRLTYQTGWRLWCEWAAQLGTDATMQKQPPCQWQQEDFPLSFQEACVLSFMSMASASKNLKPSTIATYMSGVRFMHAEAASSRHNIHGPQRNHTVQQGRHGSSL